MRTLVWIALSQAATVTSGDRAAVLAQAQPVIDRFHAAVVRCGARPPFKPGIRVAERDGIIRYDMPTGQLILHPWSVQGRAAQDDYARQATVAGRTGEGRAMYEAIFNRLLVAHELGHWLQGFQPEIRTTAGKYDDWAAEYDVNRIMIAFWREHPLSGLSSERTLAPLLSSGRDEPNTVPPPAGTTIEQFFNSNRMDIVRGGAYGWYQGQMMRRALAERPRPRFCALAARWLPLR